ncbi:TetR/AcrR family transcriptional regulator [Prauserella flavalba]|uniref:TetR/AcrR family transcriptional regulator n=1 Tax=Prauserella flavalba TaxID=1477506 RepID=UPI0036E1AA84
MPPGTREALVDAAARLLDEGGPEAVTLREVGRLAGVSHNAPYKHFADKRALLGAVAARELTGLAEAFEPGRGGDAGEVLRAAMHHYAGWALAHPERFKLVFGRWPGDDVPELGAAAETAQARLVALVAAAQESGALPPGEPERLGSLVRALTHGAVDLALSGHIAEGGKGNAGPGQLVDDLFRYLAG